MRNHDNILQVCPNIGIVMVLVAFTVELLQ